MNETSKNSKFLIFWIGVVLVIVGYFAFQKIVFKPAKKYASSQHLIEDLFSINPQKYKVAQRRLDGFTTQEKRKLISPCIQRLLRYGYQVKYNVEEEDSKTFHRGEKERRKQIIGKIKELPQTSRALIISILASTFQSPAKFSTQEQKAAIKALGYFEIEAISHLVQALDYKLEVQNVAITALFTIQNSLKTSLNEEEVSRFFLALLDGFSKEDEEKSFWLSKLFFYGIKDLKSEFKKKYPSRSFREVLEKLGVTSQILQKSLLPVFNQKKGEELTLYLALSFVEMEFELKKTIPVLRMYCNRDSHFELKNARSLLEEKGQQRNASFSSKRPPVKDSLLIALHQVGLDSKEIIALWIQFLADFDYRFQAQQTLLKGGDKVVPPLLKALKNNNEVIRFGAFEILSQLKYEKDKVIALFIEGLKSKNEKVGLNSKEEILALIQFLGDSDIYSRLVVREILIKSGEKVIPALLESLKDENPQVRVGVIHILNELSFQQTEFVSFLVEALTDKNLYVRMSAVEVLGSLGDKATTAEMALVEALEDQKIYVRMKAANALKQITGKEYSY